MTILPRWLAIWIVSLSFWRATTLSLDKPNPLARQRYLVLQLERLGMANRLRVLADWYRLAQLSNRHLLLSWVPSFDCNISFSELFLEGPPQFTVLQTPLSRGERAIQMASAMAADSNLSFATVLLDGQSLTAEMDFFLDNPTDRVLLFDQKIDVLFTNCVGPIVLPETPCQVHLTMRSQFYSSLVPVAEVLSMLSDVSEYFRDRFPYCLALASPCPE
jgi:hypothetical protein